MPSAANAAGECRLFVDFPAQREPDRIGVLPPVVTNQGISHVTFRIKSSLLYQHKFAARCGPADSRVWF